eukprot:SAG11_NODE_24378_length_374_cov_0.807273_1_plen_51_part_10
MIATVSLLMLAVGGCEQAVAQAHSEPPAVSLPYPRSKIATGQAGLTLYAVS